MNKRLQIRTKMISILTAISLLGSMATTCTLSASGYTDQSSLKDDVVLSLGSASDADNFDVYYGENADQDGLTKSTFADHFDITGGVTQHKFDVNKITDWWAQQDDYISTMIYKANQYKDFEMQVSCQGVENKVAYSWPMLVFGVEDPTKSVQQEGGGFSAFVYNDGFPGMKGYVDGIYANRNDHVNHHNYDMRNEQGYFESEWYPYTLKLRVQDGKATVTVIPLYEWGVPYSYSFDLGEEYYGGYVGLASTGQQCIFWNFKITDLGGTVTQRPAKYINTLQTGNDMLPFDCYYATDAHKGLVKADNYLTYWEHLSNKGVWRSEANTPHVEWDPYANVSSLVYTGKKYKNFELTVTMQRKESGGYGYMFPMVTFGITDPTKYVDTAGGGTAVFASAEGYLISWSAAHPMAAGSAAPAQNYYRESPHILKLSVKYGIATVTLYGSSGETLPQPFSFELPEDYSEGYISLMTTSNVCGFSNLTIRELTDCDVTPVTISEITTPDTLETPTAVLAKQLNLPQTVSALCSDGETYDVPVTWDLSAYNRFTRGDYEITGELKGKMYENHKRVLVGSNTARMTIRVTGDKDIQPIKVACVGDRITNGSIPQSYPAQMQDILGGEFDVVNFGICGTTLLKHGDYPYWNAQAYKESKAYAPNIVIIMLGTNDSKPQNWAYKNEFVSDYTALIESYRSLPSNPEVYIGLSPTVAASNYDITDAIVTNQIVPLEKQIAQANGCEMIDINQLTKNHADWYSDGVHPTAVGYGYIAKAFADGINIPKPLESISMSKLSTYIVEGQHETLSLCYHPVVISDSKDVTWSTSDSEVATVENGVVTALKKGLVTITADCHGKTASIEVQVYGKDEIVNLSLNKAEDLGNFDCYYSDDASSGLEKYMSYENYWELTDKGIQRTKSTIGDMKWGDKYVSALLYNKQQFHNFELTVNIWRKETGEWEYPMVVFGIKDPQKYILQQNGGIAVFATAEGGLVAAGQIENNINKWLLSKGPDAGYTREGVHTLKITVEYNTLTATLIGANGETMPDTLQVELGDQDMDGYIALVGKSNPCGFGNFSIRELDGHDVTKVDVDKIKTAPDTVTADVGTQIQDLQLPAKVEMLGSDKNTYDMPVEWDYDGYNRYIRGTYTLTGTVTDALQENHVKVYGNGKTVNIKVKVTGTKDLTDPDTVCYDFNGKSELNDFTCYYAPTYVQGLSEADAQETWSVKNGKLQRLEHNFGAMNGWTPEKSQSELSELVYTKRKYKNFELNVDYQRDGNTIWWAMVGFAIQDPTKFITQKQGGVAVYAEMEGRPVFWSSDRSTLPVTSPYDVFDFTGKHHIRLVVQYGVASVYLDNNDLPFKYLLSDNANNGGYISLMTNANAASYDNLSIKALPDDKSLNVSGFDASTYPKIHYLGTEEIVEDSLGGLGGPNARTGEDDRLFCINVWIMVISLGFVLLSGSHRLYTQKTGRIDNEKSSITVISILYDVFNELW